jgi:uncharacterized protein with FMN-binding domain
MDIIERKEKKMSIGKLGMGVLILATLAGVSSCAAIAESTRSMEEFREGLDLAAPNLASVRDGTYVGECEVKPIEVVVEVSVTNHAITKCVLVKHHCMLGGIANGIVDTVVSRQSLEVDTVSGATYSSLVILRAVQIALEKGL